MARPKAATTVEPAAVRATRTTAPAKLNLYLHVTGRRADGLHLLDSLIGFAELGDTLRLTPGAAPGLELAGTFAAALTAGSDNLVLRAARWLATRTGRAPAGRFHLDKALPVAAGIGGGSADAAAALRLLATHWDVDLDAVAPAELAAALGADLPVCLAGKASFVAGIGERLRPAPPLPPAALVLVNPGVALATADVFRGFGATYTAPAPFDAAPVDAEALATVLAARRNDLEAPAIAAAPAVAEALAALRAQPATLLARMSGSGATCFGLFRDDASAHAAAAAIAIARPTWWVRATRLAAPC